MDKPNPVAKFFAGPVSECSMQIYRDITKWVAAEFPKYQQKLASSVVVNTAFVTAFIHATMTAFMMARKQAGEARFRSIRTKEDLLGDPEIQEILLGDLAGFLTQSFSQTNPKYEFSIQIVKKEKGADEDKEESAEKKAD